MTEEQSAEVVAAIKAIQLAAERMADALEAHTDILNAQEERYLGERSTRSAGTSTSPQAASGSQATETADE